MGLKSSTLSVVMIGIEPELWRKEKGKIQIKAFQTTFMPMKAFQSFQSSSQVHRTIQVASTFIASFT
jgi:hypothetical protein